jgi:dipeptidase E
MRFLLTSAGIKNTSIHDALVDLLGKPIAESDALCIPTAAYGHPMSGPAGAWRQITGRATTPGSVEVVSEGHWKLFTP